MSTTFEANKRTPAVEIETALGLLSGDEPAKMNGAVYGKGDCPYGWVCVAEPPAHDLSPLALIDVYGLPEDADS